MRAIQAGPVKRLRTPGYPTRLQIQADPYLLKKHIPSSWLGNRELVAALTVALATGTGCYSVSEGCVVALPPVFMSEERALTIIKQDLAEHDVLLSSEPSVLEQYADLPIEIDAVDADKEIAVEYYSRDDCREIPERNCEDLSAYRLQAKALEQDVAASAPALHFKAFYDSTAYSEQESEGQLRQQIQGFVQWLQGQGII